MERYLYIRLKYKMRNDFNENRIDQQRKNDAINRSKKHPYQQLATDTWMAKFLLGSKVTTDIYAWLANPFAETYLKEGKNYWYDHKDLTDALAYTRTLKAVDDVNSDVFKMIHKKKKSKLNDEKISDKDMLNEINTILSKDLSDEEKEKNKNLQSYLMWCRKPLVGYSVDPNDEKRFTNKDAKSKFDDKASKHSIEDITLNKLSLMIMREYFEAFFAKNKIKLWRDNFKVRIANNYDNMMGWTHLIVWFRDEKTGKEKNFALHVNTQWTHKQLPKEITPYDFSTASITDSKSLPIRMTMKDLSWGNKELFYKFIWNAIDTIKDKWWLNNNDVMNNFRWVCEYLDENFLW